MENVHTMFIGQTKLSVSFVHRVGFYYFKGSLNTFPVVSLMSKLYCIYMCTFFCRDVLVQESQKEKLVLNASLRARQILEGELI